MASESSFQNIIFGLALFTVVSFLLISFAVGMGNNYGKSADEIGGGSLNLTAYQNNLDNVSSSAEGYRQIFSKTNPQESDNEVGIFNIFSNLATFITSPFILVGQLLYDLGVPTLVISVIMGLLSLSILFGIWRLWRLGA